MAVKKAYSILAQLSPGINVLTDLYEVPAGTQTVISSIFICNQNSVSSYFDLAFAPDGEADDVKHYLYKNQKVLPYITFVFTAGETLVGSDPTGDIIRIKAYNSGMSFNVFGVEMVTV